MELPIFEGIGSLRAMRKLAYMRYFKAITTLMTVIFLASQPISSLGFAS